MFVVGYSDMNGHDKTLGRRRLKMTEELAKFPEGFVWGATTTSYQVEGAVSADGRGESVWDRFCHTPGKIYEGHTGDVACDHFHRYKEDIGLIAELGLKGYRFSIAWPRVIPDGKGDANEAGLDFYDRLVDCLMENGVEPFVTLYHWDHPQALEDEGGWPGRAIAHRLERYARVVGERLGDRVGHWITLNEPWCVSELGYSTGQHAPGRKESRQVVAQADHHLMLAHGLAVRALRQACSTDIEVGITLNTFVTIPQSDSQEDAQAAERAWVHMTGWWTEPLLRGHYPPEAIEARGEDVPHIEQGDMEIISTPTDFLGLNLYSRQIVRASTSEETGFDTVAAPQDAELTEMGWEVWPQIIYYGCRQIEDRYPGTALYITESGAAFDDVVAQDGAVHDPRRVHYLREHFLQAHRAIGEGVDLRGYFVWSLMDNFEWSFGFSKRFGLYYVDYQSQRRIPKDSALFYAKVIKQNGVKL